MTQFHSMRKIIINTLNLKNGLILSKRGGVLLNTRSQVKGQQLQ
jgi:hypothetical protein